LHVFKLGFSFFSGTKGTMGCEERKASQFDLYSNLEQLGRVHSFSMQVVINKLFLLNEKIWRRFVLSFEKNVP